jgi:hypothetical protein
MEVSGQLDASAALLLEKLPSLPRCLGSSLYSLGADPTENTVSIVTAQQYTDLLLAYLLPREPVYRLVA